MFKAVSAQQIVPFSHSLHFIAYISNDPRAETDLDTTWGLMARNINKRSKTFH